jgi:hypothetical protein
MPAPRNCAAALRTIGSSCRVVGPLGDIGGDEDLAGGGDGLDVVALNRRLAPATDQPRVRVGGC